MRKSQGTISTGDQRVSRAVFLEHYDDLKAFLLKKTGCPYDAADIAQDTFLRVFKMDSSVVVTRPREYLFRMARNLLIDRYRGVKAKSTYSGQDDRLNQLQDQRPTPDQVVELREMKQVLRKAIDELPHKSREIFMLHRLSSLTYPEIASQRGISQSSVEKHIMLALTQCRRAIAAHLTKK